ncbi:MAG: hypothetical protein KTR25_02755 [Myxococcales bacterium]|nr:hypothetical protein [Myxococcales bacterium]
MEVVQQSNRLRSAMPIRAYRVLHGGKLLGFLGNEAGSFESAGRATEPGPPACCYRSVTPETEAALLELLHASTDFDTLLELLRRAGLTLEETSPDGLFSPDPIIYRGIAPSATDNNS